MAALLSLASAINRHVDEYDENDYQALRRAVETLEELGGGVFGFSFGADDGGDIELAGDLVSLLLDVREDEREAGNYERADALRDDLESLGVTIEDEGDGTSYRL